MLSGKNINYLTQNVKGDTVAFDVDFIKNGALPVDNFFKDGFHLLPIFSTIIKYLGKKITTWARRLVVAHWDFSPHIP
jgi:hypothetical protein